MRRAIAIVAVLGMLATVGAVWAADIGRILVTTVGVGAVVKATAGPVNKFINTVTQNRHLAAGTSTKVVPVLSVGRKGYIGAMQVAGARSLVSKAAAVVQVETEFDHGRFRIKLLVPTEHSNPLAFKRIKGLGATAMIDMGLTGSDYQVPNTRSLRAGDLLYGAAIAVAVKQFATPVNKFINQVAGTKGGTPLGATKVVPYLSFGEKAYIGAMQVAGPTWAVSKVQAVWQLEELFDHGRFRVRILVPTNSVNPLKLRRVSGVGCTAVIDAVIARHLEENRRPGYVGYRQRFPLFTGDPEYRRPPGWDQGRKEGWIKHGNPYLPPGLSKKAVPRTIIPVPADQKKDEVKIIIKDNDQEQDKGKAKGKGK